jgi:hypoxanthine phosphoribosyltransferase
MAPPCDLVASREQINDRVAHLGKQIADAYSGTTPVFIGVLPGSIVFLADLVRLSGIAADIDFVGLRPYSVEGRVALTLDSAIPLQGRDIILVLDVVDTGLTLRTLQRMIAVQRPASIESCTFVDKEHRRIVDVPVRYRAYAAGDELVLGYGIDWHGRFANAPDLWSVTDVGALIDDPGTFDNAIYGSKARGQ